MVDIGEMSGARISKLALPTIVALFVLTLWVIHFWPSLPSRPAQATIISLYSDPHSRWFSPTVTIEARSPDGRYSQMSLPADEIRCKVGDRIHATEQWISLHLNESDCASSRGN